MGVSECKKNVDDYNGRNFKSHAAPAERLSTVSSPFMVFMQKRKIIFPPTLIDHSINKKVFRIVGDLIFISIEFKVSNTKVAIVN